MTIDEAIASLQTAREKCGGDALIGVQNDDGKYRRVIDMFADGKPVGESFSVPALKKVRKM